MLQVRSDSFTFPQSLTQSVYLAYGEVAAQYALSTLLIEGNSPAPASVKTGCGVGRRLPRPTGGFCGFLMS